MKNPKVKVQSMRSPNGNAVPNQLLIATKEGTFFQSYDSIIAFVPVKREEKIILDGNTWDYSVTTGKYRNQFLSENKAQTQKKIDSGEYLLKNLNQE